mgnify:CR=1 FL=1
MTYTHLTTNELVTIEAYYQENIIKINIKKCLKYIFKHFLYAIIFINTITKENQMKRLNTLFHIIKVTGFNQFLISFVSFIFISGGNTFN